MSTAKTQTGAESLIQALVANGVDTIFGIPGESYLAHLESMRAHQELRFIVNRHEGGAAFMAESYAKLTGKTGVLFVSRFPGATNASIGIGVAHEDSSNVILFIGQVDQAVVGRESFQEIDYKTFFGSITKAVFEITDVKRIGEIVTAAFQLANNGRKGPVVVVLPHDIQLNSSPQQITRRFQQLSIAPSGDDLTKLQALLSASSRPILLVGGSGWTEKAQQNMIKFAEDNYLPVVTASRRNDLFPNDHPNYAGVATVNINRALAERILASDLVIALGCRLDEMTTGRYTLLKPIPNAEQRLIHIYPGMAELGRVYQADLLINADMAEISQALARLTPSCQPSTQAQRREWLEQANCDYIDFLQFEGSGLEMNLAAIIKHLQAVLPADTIVANGAGNNAQWLDRFYQYRHLHTKLTSVCGSMGYGVPAAIAAKLVNPDRTVISWNGDGCFQMNMNELILAAAGRLKIIFLIIENGVYGTIRQHQEKAFPCHKFGTDIENPDFVHLAKAFNCLGQRVERTEDFDQALAAAQAYDGPAIIAIKVAPEILSPDERISNLCLSAKQ